MINVKIMIDRYDLVKPYFFVRFYYSIYCCFYLTIKLIEMLKFSPIRNVYEEKRGHISIQKSFSHQRTYYTRLINGGSNLIN